jgi:hypothetical protein
VRARTSGGQVESLTVAGRFNDTDIVHVIPENLHIVGTPGGAMISVDAPPTTIVSLSSLAGGTLPAGTFNYRMTYVDASGNESPASTPTQSITVGADSTIVLQNLPPAPTGSGFVSRRLYRSDATGGGTYVLARELNASSTTISDNGSTLGAPLNLAATTVRSRLDARLAIDPGTVVKLQGSRIDVQFGAQLIAEGTPDRPVIFTSTSDVRYGAGGTFNTLAGTSVGRGNWGGIYVGPTSSASIDHAVIAYGGGTTRIEGGFADFNALEVHQGDLRLTRSRLEQNAAGNQTASDATRSGRGTNTDATVFVRGAQPIIVDNVILNNSGAAISANVSALNAQIVTDSGRSTGLLGRASERLNNHGPLVEDIRMTNNRINGLVVRGGDLTTEGVWDDTGIVHVVLDDIRVPNFHTYGGLRLQSSPDQSLVVKLRGDSAGLTATGSTLDNADRIGGSLRLVGMPGFPVIMTSLQDDSVGVGFTPSGAALTDTDNLPQGVTLLPTGPEVDRGNLIDNDVAVNIPGHFSFRVDAGGESGFGGGITAQGRTQFFQNLDVIFDYINFIDVGGNGNAFNLGNTTITMPPTLVAPDYVISRGTFTGNNGALVSWQADTYMLNGIAKVFNKVQLSSSEPLGPIQVISYLDEDVMGISDDILWVTGTPGEEDFRAYTLDGPERIGFAQGGVYSTTPGELENANYLGWAADRFASLLTAIQGNGTTYTPQGNINLANLPPVMDPSLGLIYGPADVTTAFAWEVAPGANTAVVTTFLELVPQDPSSLGGDWRSVSVDQNANDRNVVALVENESPTSRSPGANDTPYSAEYIGELAANLNSGDENRRLGFQIQGVISTPGDLDVYSFRGTAGTEVWLDIDRTRNSLDTVVELIDANGRILALSNDSLAEEADPSLLYAASDMPAESVHPLRKTTVELFPTNATGTPKDLYSTNPRDAGMRVVLPGEPGSTALYHVRVRSSNLGAGDPASKLLDPAQVGAGLTRGAYQLQIRLQEQDEVPGTSITYADIRYASTGIEIHGMPRNSPLLGEITETTANNNAFAAAQQLGNLLQTNRQAISVAGNIESLSDVDWYRFSLSYSAIRPTQLRNYFATVFDVDYADGIGRPDVSIYVFDSAGRLILSGLSSNMVDDQAVGVDGAGSSDLTRGSSGGLDPYIGSVELPVGEYFVAVTNSRNVPGVMQAFTSAGAGAQASIRLQPINGVQLIAEDHVGFSGGSTAVPPQVPVLFPQATAPVTFDLGDVTMYVSRGVGQDVTNLYIVNPLTGEVANTVGRVGNTVKDIAFRANGALRAFDQSPQNRDPAVDQDNDIDYLDINTGTGVGVDIGGNNLQTFHIDGTAAADSNDGMYPEAITFATLGGQERGFFVASRPDFLFARNNVGTTRPGPSYTRNVLYEFNPDNGEAISGPFGNKTGIGTALGAGTAVRERGFIDTGTLGALGNILVSREVTTVDASGTVRVIRDGQQFVLLDNVSFPAVFEFDSGPEVLVDYNPAAGRGVIDGLQFTLDGVVYEFDTPQGTPGVSPGAVAIPLSQTATLQEFVDAIARVMPAGVSVSLDGNRLNFSGAISGNFTAMQNRGIFTDLLSSGNVSPGAIRVPFQATDNAAALAARIAIAVNTSGIPGLSATLAGDQVTIVGGSIANAGPLRAAGAAPGGLVTGITIVGGTMYAVSDRGGLYRIGAPTVANTGNVATYVSTAHDLLGIQFAGLTTGPANLQNGVFSQTLFGIDTGGTLYAFDTAGRLQPVFANGATSVATGLFNANGLAFSTLDRNLWQTTGQRGEDPGHGLPAMPDGSREAVPGGSSWYFGVPDANVANRNYNFPGGAAGALESQAFSLRGLTAGDLPTLYFNYRLDTENAGAALPLGENANDYMRDALRVYISGEDGEWMLAATNNSTRGDGLRDDEFDPRLTGNSQVQELFDNTNSWRQARIPLDAFAGQSNVRIRIEFATAGGFGVGLQGGKGAQLRMLPGSRLADGQSFTVHGETFQIEMGPSLVLPGGAGLSHGDAVTVEGVRYVFTDGSGAPVVAPDVEVPFTATQTAAQVAAALRAAIAATPRPKATLALTATENNDTLARAIVANIGGESTVITVTGTIGDNPATADPSADVDLVRVDLARGATVVATVNAATIGSPLDSLLRIFDSAGNQLAINDNIPGSTDSRLTFVAPRDGVYYFGVSGSANRNYHPAVFGTGVASSSGNYELVLDVTRQLNTYVSENRVQLEGAASVSVSGSSSIVLQGALGATGGAVPVYINSSMTAGQVGVAVRQAIANTFSGGVTSVYALRGDTLDLTGLVEYDSIDFFTGLRAPSAAELDPGPFGATTNFIGDRFGAFNTSRNFDGSTDSQRPGALRALNNGFEGVYLDDFIIGIAGRGEVVLNAPVDTSFIVDPQLSRTNPSLDGTDLQILVGPYQLEIRGGDEYGVPLLNGVLPSMELISAVAPQERAAPGVSIRFNGASSMAAGTTFTVSDGTRTLTFEMDDVDDLLSPTPGHVPVPFSYAAFDPASNSFRAESAFTIAARVRDLINSPAVQSVLRLSAVLLNGDPVDATSDTVVLVGQPTVNVPASVGQAIISAGRGADNRQREQGQVVIQSTRVSNARDFGINITAGARDPLTGAPAQGTPRNLLTLNTDRLATGVVVMNSELFRNGAGGISISGDTAGNAAMPASVPYARLVNNTIVSGLQTGTGILVGPNASPTLLNNVIANTATAINVAPSSSSTVIGGTLFHRNLQNTGGAATLGQFPIVVPNNVTLFTDLAQGNLYPAAGSPIIDSSVDSLQDRPSIVAVKAPLGLGASPILTPQYDINGVLRVDDPSVSSPNGLGENVFKDRGAQDRGDFVGPTVYVRNPMDNDVAGLDRNPASSVVELTNVTLRHFDLQLVDGVEPGDPNRGTNIDDRTVTSSSVLVYRDNQPLVEGIDYRFGYDRTSNMIRLTPLAGIWLSSSVYTIRFINSQEHGIPVVRGLDYADGTSFDIVDSAGRTATLELDTGFRVLVPSSDGVVADVFDGETFIVDDGIRRLTFEFDTTGFVTPGRVPVSILIGASPVDVVRAVEAALRQAQVQMAISRIAPNMLQLEGPRSSAFLPDSSSLQVEGQPGVRPAFGLQIPLVAGQPISFVDGETFTIRRSGSPVTFEIDTNNVATPGRIPVRFAPGSSAATVGTALVNAIRSSNLGLNPSYLGSGLVALGGDANTVLGLGNTQLLQAGQAGSDAAVRVAVNGAAMQDPSVLARRIVTAIQGAGLTGVTATAFGGRVIIEGAQSVSGSAIESIQPISDLAGNALKANQVNGQTTVTIFLGEGLDYGDAPDPVYATRRASDGPRHIVVPGLSLGATVTPDADAKVIDLDEGDDGVLFTSTLVAAFQSSVQVSVTKPVGTNAYLSGWIDFNGDGIFAPAERVASQLLVTQATTTLSFIVPASAVTGNTWARFRLSSDRNAVALPTGQAPDGEVEDYRVTIQGNPYTNQSNNLDVNGDTFVSPIDVLQLINYLNNPANPTQLSLPRPTSGPPYLDVNGDGFITPLDALIVINHLNSLPARGSGEGEAEGEGGELVADAHTLGSGSYEVLSSDWHVGLDKLAAPPANGERAEGDDAEVLADAFFATEVEDGEELWLAATSADDAEASDAMWAFRADTVLAEADDEAPPAPVGASVRQTLASWFRA